MALPAIPNKGRRIRRFPIAAGQTYVEGAPVLLVAGEITEAGADPATILGFAAHGAVLEFDPDPGFGLVFVAYPDSTFFLEGIGGNPLPAHVGAQFELAVDAAGVAAVDVATQVVNRLLVEDIYIKGAGPTGFFEVSVLAANRQFQV